jgi:DNA-binding transcriptional LysR family regulator
MDVELRHLQAFVAAARHASFTHAAKTVHVSQPTFTVQIRQLETALGVRLLDRNTRSVRLTPIGRELAPVIERILRELESVLVNTQALSAKASGFVAVAALPTLSATMLPGIIAAFRAGNPGIAIHLREAVSARLAAMVKAGEVDFGFGSLPSGEPEVEFAPLFNDSMSAIVPRRSPFAEKRSVPLKELAATPLILMGRDSSVRTVVDRALAGIGHFSPPDYEAGYISRASRFCPRPCCE